MLGMGDFAIFSVYTLCILSALACVVYGIVNWNKGEDTQEEIDADWQKDEEDISEKLEI
jgi:hypothetical protein